MELRNPVFPVEFVGGPMDGQKKMIALKETSDILEIQNPKTDEVAVYEWQPESFTPYRFEYRAWVY